MNYKFHKDYETKFQKNIKTNYLHTEPKTSMEINPNILELHYPTLKCI